LLIYFVVRVDFHMACRRLATTWWLRLIMGDVNSRFMPQMYPRPDCGGDLADFGAALRATPPRKEAVAGPILPMFFQWLPILPSSIPM
jgi:hypothetical protein